MFLLASQFVGPGAGFSAPLTLLTIERLVSYARGKTSSYQQKQTFVRTLSSLSHLTVGAAVSCLAMVNFPQSLLALVVLMPILALSSPRERPSSLLNKGMRFSAVVAIAPENMSVVIRFLDRSTASRLLGALEDLARDQIILQRNFLDGWLGFVWPIQVIAGVCILLA